LAPDGLDEIIPFCVYLSQLEELLGGEQHQDLLLCNAVRQVEKSEFSIGVSE
jgi:hypothetical protein